MTSSSVPPPLRLRINGPSAEFDLYGDLDAPLSPHPSFIYTPSVSRSPTPPAAPPPSPTEPAAAPAALVVKSHRRHHNRTALERQRQCGLTTTAAKKLARRGGVKRMQATVKPKMQEVLVKFVTDVLRDTVALVESRRGTIVNPLDIVYALKKQAITYYGF